MKELTITIDNETHRYTKRHISERACDFCSIRAYCINNTGSICQKFDFSGKGRPLGVYGNFETVNTESETNHLHDDIKQLKEAFMEAIHWLPEYAISENIENIFKKYE